MPPVKKTTAKPAAKKTAANEWAKSAGCKKVGTTEINQICNGSIF